MTSRAFEAARATRGACVLLESTSAPSALAGRSILARHPRAVLVAGADGMRIVSRSGSRPVAGSALDALRALLRETPAGRWPDEGGVAGVLAYDAARPGPGAGTPKLVALAVDRFLVEEGGRLTGPAAAGDGAEWLGELAPPGRACAPDPVPPLDLPLFSGMTREEHGRLVRVLQDHIAAGDIYQANLSQRFDVPWSRGGLALYAALRRISPAAFAGYLRAGGLEIASASPERLLAVGEDRVATTRPLAGTRRRSADRDEDAGLAAELRLSAKDRAEHLMLVDLARNDLGRVAAIGSVRVEELMAVEEQSHVRHIVSTVRATLREGSDALDALASMFPGGTITGVPKIRCMEILDRVEPVPRGVYTGALFYATPSGRLDANILIRSAVVASGRAVFHTGGGIVADSDPAREYDETLHKAEGMRLALEAVLSGAS
jgi:anthranilate/para-aminobenzoate synthase component I